MSLGIFLPGYLILNLFPLKGRLDLSEVIVLSFGIGLLALPLSIYWANILGLPISLQGVLTVMAVLVSTTLALNILVVVLKRKQITGPKSVQD